MESGTETEPSAAEPGPARKWPRRILATALVALASALGLELAVRHLAFGDSALARRLAPQFRQAWRYAPSDSDDYWLLERRFASSNVPVTPARPDALLGWTTGKVAPGTYRNERESEGDDRRIILLYGDSFAVCATPIDDSFEALLEEADAGRWLKLLNFGGNGYGFDQTYLMLRETAARFAARRPIVVVSLLLDDDLNRMLLSVRSWPKPRFESRRGEYVLEPPVLEERKVASGRRASIRSYAWRRLVFGSGVLPLPLRRWLQGSEARKQAKRDLTRELLVRTKSLLEELEFEYSVLLFHGLPALEDEEVWWEETFLMQTLDELEMPFVSSRVLLEADARAEGRPLQDYFDPATNNHPNRLGNEVVLRGLLSEPWAADPDAPDSGGDER